MICLLNFCHKDWDQAKKLLTWIGVLGGCPNQDLILQSSITAAANGMAAELELEAQGKFRSVAIRVTDVDDERGWPYSCNNGWREAVNHIRDRTMRPWLYEPIEEKPGTPRWREQVDAAAKRFTVPWFWLEPDAVPLKPGWLDETEAAYTECSSRKKDPKYLMGGEVKIPQHRMSGVAVYPPGVAQFTRGLPYLTNNKGPWDQVLAKDFQPFVHYTPLIQNIWNLVFGEPESEPTFPDQKSLSLVDPKAVLFHRNSDGTLIDRLMEKSSACVSGLNVSPSDPNRKGGQEREVVAKPITHDLPPAGSNPAAEAVSARERELVSEINLLKVQLFQQAQHMRIQHDKVEDAKADVLSKKREVIEDKKESVSAKLRAAWVMRKERERLEKAKARGRTPEKIAADKERMAKLRARRKVAA